MIKHILIAVGVVWSASSAAKGIELPVEQKTAAELLPSSTVLYAELSRPKEVLDLLLEHPLRKRVESLDQYKQAVKTPQYRQFLMVVSVVENQIGTNWRDAVSALVEGGITVGVDAKTEGVALLIRAGDEAARNKIRDTILKLARDDAANKGNPDPFKEGDYRGLTAYELDDAKMAFFGPWVVVTNKSDMGQAVLDLYLDGGDSLANSGRFEEARAAVDGEPAAWAYADIDALRSAGVAKELFQGKAENPVVELLFGGIMSNLQKTPYVTAALQLEQDRVAFDVAVPHDSGWVDESREYYFGPEGKGRAQPLVNTADLLFSLSTYRNVSEMWLRGGDLFDENTNDGLAQADANLSTLFSGKDFGEDVLGAMQPEVQLVVTRQEFGDKTPQPAIKLPAFAIIFQLRDPEDGKDDFRRTFQSLIGFLNVVGAMNGQPQLDMDIDKEGGVQIVSSSYVAEKDERDSKEARINFNFSPSVAFVDERVIISSTNQLAKNLANAKPASSGSEPVNTNARLDGQVLHQVLSDNRRHLVAQNMLNDGNTKAEAENEIGMLLDLLKIVRDAQLRFDAGQKELRLKLEFKLALND